MEMKRFFLKKRILYICFLLLSIFIGNKFFDYQKTAQHLQGIEKLLALTSEDLNDIKSDPHKTKESVREAIDAYSQHISDTLSIAQKITNMEASQEAFVAIFRKVASQLGDIRMIQQNTELTSSQSGIIERIRDVNMYVQEQSVERLTTLAQSDNAIDQSKEGKKIGALPSCSDCNVILISLTTLRPDRMGIYGYQKQTTPHIDAFFKNSIIFRNTVAPTSWTTPNALSLFTAVFPYRHNIISREIDPIYNRKILTLAEMLKKNNYTTGAFTGGGDYNNKYSGLNRGFDFYLDEANYKTFKIKADISIGTGPLFYSPLREFLPLGTDWMEQNYKKKFFLFLQGYDPHCPLSPREPFAQQFTKKMKSDVDFSVCHTTYDDTEPLYENGKKYWEVMTTSDGTRSPFKMRLSQEDVDYMNALYDARVAEMDFYLNNFFEKLKSLGLEEKTVIVLMADHGEMLGEHGRFMRGGTIRGNSYKQSLHFPLLIKHPKITEPLIVEDIVNTVDIMPTLLSMLDITDPQEDIRQGHSLHISNFQSDPTNEYGFSGAKYERSNVIGYFDFPTASESVQDKKWKLIKETIFDNDGFSVEKISYKLFDLENDPNENINLYDAEREEAEKLKVVLEKWLDQYR